MFNVERVNCMHVQIRDEDCTWFGRNACASWSVVMVVMAVSVSVDLLMALIMGMFDKSLRSSVKTHRYSALMLFARQFRCLEGGLEGR